MNPGRTGWHEVETPQPNVLAPCPKEAADRQYKERTANDPFVGENFSDPPDEERAANRSQAEEAEHHAVGDCGPFDLFASDQRQESQNDNGGEAENEGTSP